VAKIDGEAHGTTTDKTDKYILATHVTKLNTNATTLQASTLVRSKSTNHYLNKENTDRSLLVTHLIQLYTKTTTFQAST
jgi:hypothetical protein